MNICSSHSSGLFKLKRMHNSECCMCAPTTQLARISVCDLPASLRTTIYRHFIIDCFYYIHKNMRQYCVCMCALNLRRVFVFENFKPNMSFSIALILLIGAPSISQRCSKNCVNSMCLHWNECLPAYCRR